MTPGGDIYEAGNSKEFKTGDWRSIKPIFHSDKCKQCGLCFPVCPEDAIPVNCEQKEKILTTIIVKAVVYVLKYAHLELLQWKMNNLKGGKL